MSPCPLPDDDGLAGLPAGRQADDVDEDGDDDDDCLIEAEMEVEDPDLARYQAETDRLRTLVEFVQRPTYMPHLADGKPDDATVAECDLAVFDALQTIRRITAASGW